MRIGLLAAVVGAAGLAGCECLEAKSGTLSVDTDCAGGAITHAVVPFAQAPNAGLASSQFDTLLSNVPTELKAFLGDLACDELINPQSLGDLCAPVGVGGGDLTKPLEIGKPGDTRVVMCGGEMFAIGGFDGGFYFCRADQAVIDGQIWFMECQQFSVSTNALTGSCEGVVEFDQIVGT